jgi:hypothetical protein
MKKIIFAVFLLTSSPAFAMAAYWTGNKEEIQTSTGETHWKCEYRVAYRTQLILVWRTFANSCPEEIEIESDGD